MNKLMIAALAATTFSATSAGAATISQSQILTSIGQDMTFDFMALPTNIISAFVTIASGMSGGTEGLDLSGAFSLEDEYFEVSLDGAGGGFFSCGGPSSVGATAIAGATDNSNNFNNCVFSLDVAVTDLSLFADGMFSLGVLFGDDVSTFGDDDEVVASLTYTVAAVPLPATLGLMLFGVGGLGAAARRKRR